MNILATSTRGTYETTVSRELDDLIETPDNLPQMFSALIDHLLEKQIIQPEDLTNIFNTYRTYTAVPQ
jgi:hypothetical protein